MKYTTVIFDWDGTVVDSAYTIVTAIQAAAKDLGLEPPTEQRASWVIGLSLRKALLDVVPGLTRDQLDAFTEAYRKHYFAADPDLKLFDGIKPLLYDLKARGLNLAVATGKSRFGLDKALANHELVTFFDVTRTADQTRSKPHPQMLEEIFEELMVSPDECVMVGDTSHDILMAQSAGCDSIAVSYGAHSLREINEAKPTYIANAVGELEHLLNLYTVRDGTSLA